MNGLPPLMKIKVVVVGDAGVGKTSLAVRFTEDSFFGHYKQTVGASFCSRALDVNGKRVVFQIWDTAGQERFRSLVPMYLRDAEVALIVYDISSHKSFENIDIWTKQLQQHGPQNMKCALIGNKVDLEDLRAVTKEEAVASADLRGIYSAETSAKTGESVLNVFYDIGTALVSENRQQRQTSVISISDSYIRPRRQANCCHR